MRAPGWLRRQTDRLADARRAATGTATTLAAATALGLVGHLAGVPGGALLGALVAAALVAHRRPVRLPAAVGAAGRWLVGAVAGSLLTLEVLRGLGPVLAWGALGSLLMVLAGLAGGWWAARVTGLDQASGIVAAVPGGLSELTGLANELDLRTDVVIAVHLVRRIGVVVLAVTLLAAWP